MRSNTLQIGFFILLIALTTVLTFFIFKPYLSFIFLAIIISILFEPLHGWVLMLFGDKKSLAALVSTLLVFAVFLVPLTFFGALLFQESVDLYSHLRAGNGGGVLDSLAKSLGMAINQLLPSANINVTKYLQVDSYVGQAVSWLSGHLADFFSSVARGALGVFLMLLAVFYLFRDGKKLVKTTVALSPLNDVYDQTIIKKIHLAVDSVVKGQLMVGLIQGVLTGVGFAIFGVPNPVIWGFVGAIAALVPSLGTALVSIPAILYLFTQGQTTPAIGLIFWSVLAVGLIDNLLGPILMDRGVKIHPFLILVSVLGGLAFFGPVGFMAGPVVLALFFVLLEIYPAIFKKTTQS